MSDSAAHAALMNGIYAKQRRIYDLTRKYYLLGRDRLIEDLAVPDGGRVLEVACGTGRNLAKIGARYPRAELYGFDISSEMLINARQTLGDRARLAEGDATDFDPQAMFGVPGFDRVVISYALSMIARARHSSFGTPSGKFPGVPSTPMFPPSISTIPGKAGSSSPINTEFGTIR